MKISAAVILILTSTGQANIDGINQEYFTPADAGYLRDFGKGIWFLHPQERVGGIFANKLNFLPDHAKGDGGFYLRGIWEWRQPAQDA